MHDRRRGNSVGAMSNSSILELLARLFPPDSAAPDWSAFVAALSGELDDAICMVWSAEALSEPIAVHPSSASAAMSGYHSSRETELEFLHEAEYPVGCMHGFSNGRELPPDGGRFQRDVIEPLGHGPSETLVIPLASDGRLITAVLMLAFRSGFPVSAVAAPLLDRLMPWILYAARAMFAQQRRSDLTSALRQTIDRLSAGMILLDVTGKVIFANRSAASMLEGQSVPSFVAGGASSARASKFHAALDIMLEGGGERGRSRGSGLHRRLLFTRIDVVGGGPRPFGGTVAAVILMTPDGALPAEALEQARERYGLTPAEARLALHLSSGLSLDEAAGELGVAVGTVRTRLKQVFAKTGTHRQASLVRLLMADAGQIRADHERSSD